MTGDKDIDYLKRIVIPLLAWYHANRRILPWREEPTPYRVWISEIMLQQTRVEAGKSYFQRFVAELPDVASLANVDDELLMKLWEGLGYYNRARNLKKAAGIVVEKYGGSLPGSYEELLGLPGIGPYTAGAVSSIAFQIPMPAVDGNVLRVISRIMARRHDIAQPSVKKAMEQEIRSVMPKERPGDFNQALMELGAIVCLPNGAPKCSECPVNHLCRASNEGIAEELPVKKSKKERRIEEKTVLILIDETGRMALRKRPAKGLLSGLWELPSLEGRLSAEAIMQKLKDGGISCMDIQQTQPAKHIFSHIEWRMIGYVVRVAGMSVLRTEGLAVAEQQASYLTRDLEQQRQMKEKKQEQERSDGLFDREELLFIDGKALADIYALPSAFRGFRDYFPAEIPADRTAEAVNGSQSL